MRDADIGGAKDAVAERIDHVQDRVGFRNALPEFRQ